MTNNDNDGDSLEEQAFADFFTLYAAGIAEELGIKRTPGVGWTGENAVRLETECRKRFFNLLS